MAHVFIFILSVLFLTESVVGYTQFGCNFNDENYTVDTASTGNGEEPVWGGEIQTAVFTTREEFTEFKNQLNEMSEKVLSNFIFNTMDSFFEFYDSYKSKTEKENELKLDDFYKQYKEPYRPYADEAGFIIALVAEMTEKYPEVANKVFLSTCSSNIPTGSDVISRFNRNKLTDDLPIDWFHGNIAGIIKITVQGKEGYVFLSYWLALEKRIVPMIEKKSGYIYYLSLTDPSPGTGYNTSRRIVYNADIAQRYILATSKYGIVGQHERSAQQLCYIGKPYCSFLQTTSKPHLTRPNHAMMRYDNNGDLEAALEAIFIYYPNEKKVNTSITVWTRRTSGAYSELEIKKIHDSPLDKDNLTTLSEQLLETVNHMEDTITKLQRIKNDDSFFKQLQAIDGSYNRGQHNQTGQSMRSSPFGTSRAIRKDLEIPITAISPPGTSDIQIWGPEDVTN